MIKNKNIAGLDLINKTVEKYSNNFSENKIKYEVFNVNIKKVDYSFVRLNDNQYGILAENSIPIEDDYIFIMYLYNQQNTIFSSFPRFYVTLKELTGESGKHYDTLKGAFSFPFLISFKKNNYEYDYLMNVINIRSGIEFRLRKLVCGNDNINRETINYAFEDFTKDDINHFIAYFVGFLDGYFKSYVSKNCNKFFFKEIKSENILFGYKNGKFFEKQYERESNYYKKLKSLEKYQT